MEASKIILSEAEQQLISDAEVILTKNNAIDKIGRIFGNLSGIYLELTNQLHPPQVEAFQIPPKISKGEKHQGLPWIMLDYPRSFDKSNGHLAIRTFFWWGNFFSIQLQASGIHYEPCLKVYPNWSLNNMDWLAGITYNPWDLDLPNHNWISIENKSSVEERSNYFMMAKKIPISDWENLEGLFAQAFEDLLIFLKQAG